MTVVVYPALVAITSGLIAATFPDLATVRVEATTQAELLRLSRERLSDELQRLERDEAPWPDPTPLERLSPAPGESILLIDVSVDDTPIRLTISLGERLVKRIDQDAESRSMTRSGYLALGARRLLGEASHPFRTSTSGEDRETLREEIAALGRRVNEALGPDSPVARTLAELDALALEGLRRLGGEVKSAFRQRRRQAESEAQPGDPMPATDAEPRL